MSKILKVSKYQLEEVYRQTVEAGGLRIPDSFIALTTTKEGSIYITFLEEDIPEPVRGQC